MSKIIEIGVRRLHAADIEPVKRREIGAWAMFDFANSGYTTVVITAIFSAWFVSGIAQGANWGTLAWTLSLSASYLIVLLSAPVIGAWADLRAGKRRLLLISTSVCIVATGALGFCGPGDVALAIVLLLISNVAYSAGENLIAAFLPELVQKDAMGKVSGWGWGLGYFGGLLALGLCLWWIQGAEARGSSTDQAVPQTLFITPVLFGLAALPTFLLLRERARPVVVQGSVWREAGRRVRASLSGTRGLLDLRRLLICITCFQAGVQTVIALAAIYTQQALGFTVQQSIQLILVVNITAALGALAFGQFQDRIGHRRTLAITLCGWLLAIVLLWISEAGWVIWTAANLVGLCMGASQSAGRAMVGYLCPPHREAEIFGLWGLAVKLASILGPLSYGLVNWFSGGDHRLSILATAGFFVGGLLLLMRVDVARGRARTEVG
jgi:UMF1 family MFS transporter